MTASVYREKTVSLPHQLDEYLEHREDIARGLLWEMGTGKSKEVIDQACHLYLIGRIDAIVIVAPDGVHRNWITDEIPKHMPDDILAKTKMFTYQTEKAQTKWHQAACASCVPHPGLLVVAMSYDATTTDPTYTKDPITQRRTMCWKGGKRFLWDLLSDRKVLYVIDESRRIKNPKADRTKVILKSAPYAPYRRILNGTPVANGPFDLYSQLKFLDENFWTPHGISTYSAFKTMFGIFQKAEIYVAGGVKREFDQLLGYKNLDLLQRILKTICSRVTKDEVLKLPPKLYSRAVFEMSAAQQKVYNDLKEEFVAWIDGNPCSAPLAITRLLRFQQITSGFVPVESGDDPIVDIGKTNPRLELLETMCEDIPHKAIIWARFTRTVDKVMDILGKRATRYDGKVTGDDRELAKNDFQKGDKQFFVAKASTAGEGLTLHAARTVLYLENTFDLAERLQSEDRAHRIGQEHPVNYVDFVALGSVDEKIVASLVTKFDIAGQITGDAVKQWLQAA